jgi:acyl-CoA synthetase (NDP forming)
MSELSQLFAPRSIAVVGASANPASIGNRVLALLLQHDFPGEIYPVNPSYGEIEGRTCYPAVGAIGAAVDLAIIAVRQNLVVPVVKACAEAGVGACIIMSAGFGEGGAGTSELEELRGILREAPLRICGPNSLGVFSPARQLAATFSTSADKRRDLRDVKAGSVAILSQSGALGFSIMHTLAWGGTGIGAVASPGNSVDLDVTDFIEYWVAQPDIDFVCAIIEEIRDIRRMHELGRAVRASGKPVAVLKLGKSDVGQRASLSHTGAMSGSADVYRGFFRQYGMIEVADVPELIALARLLARQETRYGPRIAILTPSGGTGILITDLLSSHGLTQPETSPVLAAGLRDILPPYSSVMNPIDVTAQATANADESGSIHAQEVALARVLDSGEYDVVITHVPVSARTVPRLEKIAGIASGTRTAVVVYSDRAPSEAAVLGFAAAQLPWFTDAETMVRALAAIVRWNTREDPRTTAKVAAPRVLAGLASPHFEQVRRSLAAARLGGIREVSASDPDSAAAAAAELGYPVVIKLDSRDAAHKTELDGVRTGISDTAAALDAATQILRAAGPAGLPGARLGVQEQVAGVEALVSFRRDERFGPTVTLGCGGIHTELLRQFSVRLAPVSDAEAEAMIDEVSMLGAQLAGLRGRAPADRAALSSYVAEFSRLAATAWDGVHEVEVNPLIVRQAPDGVAAVDLVVD